MRVHTNTHIQYFIDCDRNRSPQLATLVYWLIQFALNRKKRFFRDSGFVRLSDSSIFFVFYFECSQFLVALAMISRRLALFIRLFFIFYSSL